MKFMKIAVAGMICVGAGCESHTPPPRAEVPPPELRDTPPRPQEPIKPLPPPDNYSQVPPAPFDDPPLLNQPVPQAQAFVDAYNKIGRPRIAVFMNRTLEGKIIPVNPNDPVVSVEVNKRENNDRSNKSVDVYLPPGQYDEAWAKAIDYEAMENTLTDWIACNGQVTIVSPMMARQKLTDQQVQDLKDGRPQVLRELAQQLDVDVLVHLQARPTEQSRDGMKVRIVAEAINTKGGESIGRAVVDTPLPLEKQLINRHTRFLASKLMDGMIGAWMTAPPPTQPQNP